MLRSAKISSCGKYRFALTRTLGSVLFVLNNPSTADDLVDDPTVKRGIGFAKAWGYGKLYFGNTNPHRSTNPVMARVPNEVVMFENDMHLYELAATADLVVAAWGDKAHPVLAQRALTTLRGVTKVHHLGLTKAGNPRHPLYLPAGLVPVEWNII